MCEAVRALAGGTRYTSAHSSTIGADYEPLLCQESAAMSGIKDSIKGLFAQVFGRADFADVLEDRWQYSETFEGEVIEGELPSIYDTKSPAADAVQPTTAMRASPRPAQNGTEPLEEAEEVFPDLPDNGKPDRTAGRTPPERADKPKRLERSPVASLSPDTVESAPSVPEPASSSLDTGDLIAQIAFDSPSGLYPGPAGMSDFLSDEVDSLSAEGDLGAIVAGAQTTAVVKNERPPEEGAAKRAPLRLVKKEGARKSSPQPLRLSNRAPDEQAASGPDEDDTLREAPRRARDHSYQFDEENEEDPEHIVSSRSIPSPTLTLSYEEHAPYNSDKLSSLLHSSLMARLEEDLDNLDSQAEEDTLHLLLEALDDPKVDLPPFPAAARRLLGSGSEAPDEDDILDVVKSDPGLAGSVIRAANSPFYMAAAPVASLGSAVVRIGLREVRRVALAAAMAATFDVKGFAPLIDSAHIHSLTTGTSAEALSRTFSVEPGVAFLSGLLHNAGELLTYRLLGRAFGSRHPEDAPWNGRLPFVREVAIKYHCYFGAMFIEPWDLPAELRASLVYHHHPYLAGDEHEELASLIHVANGTAEVAMRHARTDIWQEYLSRLEKNRDHNSSSNNVVSLGADGIELVPVVEIMEMLPPGFPKSRIHTIIRDILLRVSASALSSQHSHVAAVTQY